VEQLQPLRDVIGPGIRLLLVGINPGVMSATTGYHFARPGNRFWPALHAAGITPRVLRPAEQDELSRYGVGVTNLVARPSATAAEVTAEELRAGGRRLQRLVGTHQPRVVAILGLTAFRVAFSQPKATAGRQPRPLGGAELWVLPNPSGLNAHTKPADHAAGLRAAALAAEILPPDQAEGGAAANPRRQPVQNEVES
jgi:double-stranded uracil-DNA glycosylase